MRRRQFMSGMVGIAGGLGLSSRAGAAPVVRQGGWQEVPAPAGAPAALLAGVAAAAADLAWAVGEEGRAGSARGRPLALRWDGAAWARTDVSHLGFTGSLRSVTSASTDAAWALGYDTTGADHLLTWSGSTWQEVRFPGRNETGTELHGAVAAPDGQVWIAGRHEGASRLLHFDGRVWRWTPPLPGESPATLWNAHLAPDGSPWASGDVAARFDGRGWTVLPSLGGIRPTATDLLPLATDDVWLTGNDFGIGGPPGKPPSVILRHWDGASWTSAAAPFTVGSLNAIAADEQGRPSVIAGWDFWDPGTTHYLRYDGQGGWLSERGPLPPEGQTPMMSGLAEIPGTGGLWSVGTTSRYPFAPAQPRIERFG